MEVGDRVLLAPRHKPHDYPAAWLWEITDISDRGIDVVARHNGALYRRYGVAPCNVLSPE